MESVPSSCGRRRRDRGPLCRTCNGGDWNRHHRTQQPALSARAVPSIAIRLSRACSPVRSRYFGGARDRKLDRHSCAPCWPDARVSTRRNWTRVRRIKDGGFGAAARDAPFTASRGLWSRRAERKEDPMRIGENSMTPIEALYQCARTSPNGVAFIVGDDKWKYGWLAAQAERLARGLVGRGIRKGDRIALHMPNRPEFVVAVYACVHIW